VEHHSTQLVSPISVKNFLKPDRHTHKDPQVRAESLSSLDGSTAENQMIIERMATADDDESVRLAAIDKLPTVTMLQRVLDAQSTNTNVAGAVETRIISLLSDNKVSESEANELLAKQDSIYAPLIAINSADETIRLSSLAKLDNESAMVAVVEQTRFHDVRLACAEKLNDEENIKLALVACRSRDKVVAKLLQSRIDEKAAAIAEQEAISEAVAATLSSMQSLAESGWFPQYSARHTSLTAKWTALDATAREPSQSAFSAADDAAKKVISEHDKKVADELAATASVTDDKVVARDERSINDTNAAANAAAPGASAASGITGQKQANDGSANRADTEIRHAMPC